MKAIIVMVATLTALMVLTSCDKGVIVDHAPPGYGNFYYINNTAEDITLLIEEILPSSEVDKDSVVKKRIYFIGR